VSAGAKVVTVHKNIRLDRRKRSPFWQARVKLADGSWQRFSTKTDDVDDAKDLALKYYYAADERLKNRLPQNTRKFKGVARFARDRMKLELADGGGKVVFKDYITAIDRYLIPFFGALDVATIDVAALKRFDAWRTQQMGKPAAHSTINTHNSALNRVLDEAELRGWITQAIRPTLLNRGKAAISRGSFSKDEYQQIYRALRTWADETNHPKAKLTRVVLRNYVLFLANTGIRHGTEAMNPRWRNIAWVDMAGQRYLAIYPNGKTGSRESIARDRAKIYLDRQRALNPRLASMTFDEVLTAKSDEWIFCNNDGERESQPDLARNFMALLDRLKLKLGADGKTRSLYSWRHFYATQDLQRGTTTAILSGQMGNSSAMLDRFYSKLQPRMNAAALSGRAEQTARSSAKATASATAKVLAAENTASAVDVATQPVAPINAAVLAFDLFDAGTLSEPALLAAAGVARAGYVATDTVAMRALSAFQAGKLSEAALMQLLAG